MRLLFLFCFFGLSFQNLALGDPKTVSTIEGTVVSPPILYKSSSGVSTSYSFKVKSVQGAIVAVTYTTRWHGKSLINFNLKEGDAFKESGELIPSKSGIKLKKPFLGSFFVNRLAQMMPPPTNDEAPPNVRERLFGIYTALQAFHGEFGTYTSDFVGAGIRLPKTNTVVCGFSGPFKVTKKEAESYTKSERINDTFLDPDSRLISGELRKLLEGMPKDAIAAEKTFKVACLTANLDIWTIDEKKNLKNVSSR